MFNKDRGKIHTFCQELYELDHLGEYEASRFKIFYRFQNLINDEDFLLVHRLLKYLRPAKLSESSIRAVLSSTWFFDRKCPARALFYEKAETSLKERFPMGNWEIWFYGLKSIHYVVDSGEEDEDE